MKRRIVSIFAALFLLIGIVSPFASGAAAEGAYTMCDIESAEPGRITLSNVGQDMAYRLVLPDGTRTIWSVRGEYDDDVAVFAPLDGGDYRLETCLLDALTVLDAQSDYLPEKYDLRSDVPANQIHTSEAITVAQPEEEGDNIVDLAEGNVLLSPSYNAYAVFENAHDFYDSDFDYSAITHGPAIRYVSTDDGAAWKTLTGDVTLTTSSAEPVKNGVRYALYCGDYTTTITLDNVKTTGHIDTAPFGDTVLKIQGDVSVGIVDTEYFGKLTMIGADASAKLTVTRALLSSSIEIRDLAELNMECPNIALNAFMGDVKLTNIREMDIAINAEEYASGICCYDGNVIFTDVYGTVALTYDLDGKVIETGEGKKFIINASGADVLAGADREHLQQVALQTEGTGEEQITGIFPMDQLAACLTIQSSAANP